MLLLFNVVLSLRLSSLYPLVPASACIPRRVHNEPIRIEATDPRIVPVRRDNERWPIILTAQGKQEVRAPAVITSSIHQPEL